MFYLKKTYAQLLESYEIHFYNTGKLVGKTVEKNGLFHTHVTEGVLVKNIIFLYFFTKIHD